MRRSAVVLPLFAAALVFVACSERDSTSPRLPSGANFSQALTPATTCDFTQISKAAKVYFTSGQDPVFTLIGNMKAAAEPARTSLGWQIMRQVAAERLSSATGASSDGAIFVNDVLRCTTYSFPPTLSSEVQQNFLTNLALVLGSGVFNVRGGTGDPTDAAAALDASSRVLAQPHWGVEGHPWANDGPYLVWGYPALVPNVVVSPATNINTNVAGTYNGFELGTIPNSHSKSGMLVGICYQSVSNGNTANRLDPQQPRHPREHDAGHAVHHDRGVGFVVGRAGVVHPSTGPSRIGVRAGDRQRHAGRFLYRRPAE